MNDASSSSTPRATAPSPPPASFEGFTERAYAQLVTTARQRFDFEPFGTDHTGSHLLWRHDVDVSVHRALALARIEAAAGVRSTWFLLLSSSFYNVFESDAASRARGILTLGHWLGLHFDLAAYPGLHSLDELETRADRERRVLEEWLEHPVAAISLHNPDVRILAGMRADRLAGLPNAYASSLDARYTYVSDSNGYWRYRALPQVLSTDPGPLHVLTHPEWWSPEPLSPRQRVQRSIDGRARTTLAAYDALLAQHGRINLGSG
jgi:hypothetical protein